MKITKLSIKSKLAAIGLTLLVLTLFTPTVLARDWWGQAQDGGLNQIGSTAFQEDSTPTDVRVIAGNIIKAFLGLFGTIFVILIVIGGFKWMTAAGDKEKITSAGKYITNGIIGLLISVAAFAIAVYVTSRIVTAVKTGPTTQATTQLYG
jgi:hypothetical protein